ncbi:dipeptidase [Paenactinomyces guangxiensis]|uniref:Membrane dipeptidase n=1 Tax=Paenactinomyces guangxiensis TaxID=1490290 RepID=A0A7W1WQW1_9BACL|nr:dipeptidase [Paenactinomyces guangxiensis]MBA4494423.1 membrane dipeptidase [Paenactinomyces guangxiensis]MBH8591522.1 dipeptidase [Paenactinomyces guangxiensis]
MRSMDGHCDVLLKMWLDQEHSFYDTHSNLDVTYLRLREGQVGLQTFAIYIPPTVAIGQKFEVAVKQIDEFYEKVIQDGEKMFLVTSGEQLDECSPARIGALLSLEGADALQGELKYLRTFYRLGVRKMGLTWNHANEVADGIQEERGGGLTSFGREVVEEMKRLGMILDVSHLSIKGFWEVIEYPDLPVYASHSNCRAVCPHVRNLEDDQIKALINRDGLIGITYVTHFVKFPHGEVTIDDLIKHIEHVCELGGENQIFFGSDFDGIDKKIRDLEHAGQVNNLKKALLKRYPETLVKKWAWENGYRFYLKNLPSQNVKKTGAI